jgi:hypothetical protein
MTTWSNRHLVNENKTFLFGRNLHAASCSMGTETSRKKIENFRLLPSKMAIGPTGNWTKWQLDQVVMDELAIDQLAIGPFGNWTNWKMDQLAFGPSGYGRSGNWTNW